MSRLSSITCLFVLQTMVASITAAQHKPLIFYPTTNTRPLKQALGFLEDSYLNFTELATKYGYPTEEHTVTTQDGYLLTIFRILSKCDQTREYPVILMHGLMGSSDSWILTGPKEGMGYILSTRCFDVWVPNHRGNTYSRKHISLNPDRDAKYWEFSFDEIGNYDVPAIIDYILSVTQQRKIFYIGHSQGVTEFFVMGSMKPEYNNKVQLSIHLAPVVWLKSTRNPILKLLSLKTGSIESFLKGIGIREVLAKHQILHQLIELLCQIIPIRICGTLFIQSTGASFENIRLKTLAIVFGHLFEGVSVKTLGHFAQLIVSQKFQRYDEGPKGNLARYRTIAPPKYNVTLVTSPVVLIAAGNDLLSDLQDVEMLSSKLPNLVDKHVIPDPSWSHNDYLWGINSVNYVTIKILDYLETFNTR